MTATEETYRLYYLNNSGHRWVGIDKQGNRERVDVAGLGSRAILYWEASGNFAFPVIRIKGKRVRLTDRDGAWHVA